MNEFGSMLGYLELYVPWNNRCCMKILKLDSLRNYVNSKFKHSLRDVIELGNTTNYETLRVNRVFTNLRISL